MEEVELMLHLGMGNAALWGLFSGLAYFAIAYMIWFGEAKQLAM